MDIKSALQKTGKATCKDADYYAQLKDINGMGDRLFWYDKSDDSEDTPVQLNSILDDIWQPYHDKEGIRPEKAGELWQIDELIFASVRDKSTGQILLRCCQDDYVWRLNNIHGENWERIHPPVEDDSVERIVYEDVNALSFYVNDDMAKSPLDVGQRVKMILEIPKEKS